MRFRPTKHHSKQGAHHGRPVAHGRFIGMPHRKGVLPMDALDVPFADDANPIGSVRTPVGGADIEPDAGTELAD